MSIRKRPRPTKTLKGGGKGAVRTATDKPVCRDHAAETMVFDPLQRGWVCPISGCNFRRYKKAEVDQYGPPLICEGPFTLTVVESANSTVLPDGSEVFVHDRLLLRGSNNVAVDLTPIVRGVNMGSLTNPTTILELAFNSLTVIPADGTSQ